MFIHFDLPRAAGDTLMACVEKTYGPERVLHIGAGLRFDINYTDLLSLNQEQISQIKSNYDCLVTKHSFPLHEIFDVPYVGFVRNPLNWYISSYFWAKKTSYNDQNEMYGLAIAKYNFTLDQFVFWLHDIGHDNIQAKNLIRLAQGNCDVIPPRLNDIILNENSLTEVFRFIEQRFAVFAPTEMFGRAVYAMGMLFDWPYVPLWQRQSSSSWQSSLTISEELAEYVRERNQYDWALFEQASSMFECRFVDVMAACGSEADDYDVCSQKSFDDATPFHFASLPADLLAQWRNDLACRLSTQAISSFRRPEPQYFQDRQVWFHSEINGHMILSLSKNGPLVFAYPKTYMFNTQGEVFNVADLLRPGVLVDVDVANLSLRLQAGETPGLIESHGSLTVWFWHNRYYFLDGIIEGGVEALYANPVRLLTGQLNFCGKQEASQFFRMMTDPFYRQLIDNYQILEEEHTGLWRALRETDGNEAFAATTLASLLVKMQSENQLTLRAPPPHEHGSLLNYNIIQWQDSYYGAMFGAGTLDQLLMESEADVRLLKGRSPYEIHRQIMGLWLDELSIDEPRLIESRSGINVVSYLGRLFYVPQNLGAIDFHDQALDKKQGIQVSHSLKRIQALLGELSQTVD